MERTNSSGPEGVFVVGIGALMVALMFLTFFIPTRSHTGSNLVPADLLQDIRDEEARLQTHRS